jgi:hypothetical protein
MEGWSWPPAEVTRIISVRSDIRKPNLREEEPDVGVTKKADFANSNVPDMKILQNYVVYRKDSSQQDFVSFSSPLFLKQSHWIRWVVETGMICGDFTMTWVRYLPGLIEFDALNPCPLRKLIFPAFPFGSFNKEKMWWSHQCTELCWSKW